MNDSSDSRDSRDFTEKHRRVYGSPGSLYTAKIRPALRAKYIPYVDVWPSPDVYDYMEDRSEHRFMPVVVTDENETLQDSPLILERLEEIQPEPPLFPADPATRLIAHLIEDFCDEILVIPSIHYRWSAPEQRDWVVRHWTAGKGSDASEAADRMLGARPMLGITDATMPAIETWYEAFVEGWNEYFLSHRYVLGERLTLADLALAGSSTAMMGQDPIPLRLLREKGPRMMAWLFEVNHPIPASIGAAPPKVGDDLRPILKVMADAFVPYQLEADRFVSKVLRESDADELPRFAGATELPIFGVRETRGVQLYSVWRHQRTIDRFDAMAKGERAEALALIEGTKWVDYLQTPPSVRLEKSGSKLIAVRSATEG